MMVSISEMEIMLNELASEFPRAFYKDLNGGIIMIPEKKVHKKAKANDLYILGEYHHNRNLGRFIAIYYGSFSKVAGNLSREQLKKKLRSTLKHEFRHHLESLAGERDLEIEDEQYLADYLKRYGRNK